MRSDLSHGAPAEVPVRVPYCYLLGRNYLRSRAAEPASRTPDRLSEQDRLWETRYRTKLEALAIR